MVAVLDMHQVRYVVIGGLVAALWGSDLACASGAGIILRVQSRPACCWARLPVSAT